MVAKPSQVNLPRGTAARLARRFRLTNNHVLLVIKGERVGKPSLMAAIERERQRVREQQQSAA